MERMGAQTAFAATRRFIRESLFADAYHHWRRTFQPGVEGPLDVYAPGMRDLLVSLMGMRACRLDPARGLVALGRPDGL